MTKNSQSKNDLLIAKEMARYENKWVGISKVGGREKIVSSGNRITDAKAEADKKGIKSVIYRKVLPNKKVLNLRDLILEGATSKISLEPLCKKYFDALRERAVRNRATF